MEALKVKMEIHKFQIFTCKKQTFKLLFYFRKKFRKLYAGIRFLFRRQPRPRVVIRRLLKLSSKGVYNAAQRFRKRRSDVNGLSFVSACVKKPIRISTFNAALFAGAPVLPNRQLCYESSGFEQKHFPYSILKNSPLHQCEKNKFLKPKPRVSINLPENEISLSSRSKLLNSSSEFDDSNSAKSYWSSVPVRSPLCFPSAMGVEDDSMLDSPSIFDVLKEMNADILALQDVKAEEERGMQPLSSLADALGMKYVFAESWAPEYGNAILSKWPIIKWSVHKILEHEDIRNVLKATIDVPWSGEINVYCTQLDYLDEDWRMRQIKSIARSSEGPHILAGGLNSLDRSDYSQRRWTDIVKYYEDIGKPKPKDEVMKFLKTGGYEDAKDYTSDCQPVVIATKGQSVQGTCKYGTRVDYILSSYNAPYKFLPGSYSVISSKGTSDHHAVKVDIVKNDSKSFGKKMSADVCRSDQKVVRLGSPFLSRGLLHMER